MSATNSRLAYQDCYELMDQALSDDKGIRVQFESVEEVTAFRLRLHHARQLHRNENAEIYEAGHAMHGHSIYDALVAKIRKDEDELWWLYLEKQATSRVVESLSEASE